MPIKTITLAQGPMNISLQKGDVIYYCQTVSGQSGKNHPNTGGINTQPLKLGVVISFNRDALTITVDLETLKSLSNVYLFFIKDGIVNHSGIIGSWLETEYRNYSTLSSEIFATATDFVESSR